MMSVRAKFRVESIESSLWVCSGGPREMRTIKLLPVMNGDPDSENKKFWDATPIGRIELGAINPDAWKQFELGKEYYVDFVRAGVATNTKEASKST